MRDENCPTDIKNGESGESGDEMENEDFENDYGSGFGLLWLVYFLTGNSVVIFAKMSDKRPLPR